MTTNRYHRHIPRNETLTLDPADGWVTRLVIIDQTVCDCGAILSERRTYPKGR